MLVSIYTLTSALHDEKSVEALTKSFLDSLGIGYELKGDDYSSFGESPLNLIYVRTGGTEGIFKELLPSVRRGYEGPFYLLTSGKSNSLAASMEILSYLNQEGLRGEILHGSADYVRHRIEVLDRVSSALLNMRGKRLGIIGAPSDWLISSLYDPSAVQRVLGMELESISMDELLSAYSSEEEREPEEPCPRKEIREALPGAERIYRGLKRLVDAHSLSGLTIRCFDLLTAVHNTGCLALARLNAEGIIGGCEGDVPTMLSMMILQSLTGKSGFQANPSSIDPERGEMVFAHCTIPFNMVEHYDFDTHFESGIGVGIHGEMAEGDVTVFKVSGDLSRWFVAEGRLLRNEYKPDLCRTQVVVGLDDPSQARYFLTNPIGNHHVIISGHWKEEIELMMHWKG